MIPSKKITVLLAEDHAVVREGFRTMLEAETDLEVLGEAQEGRTAVALALKLRPDVVLMDIAMPLLNGLEATRQLVKAQPGIRILILSAHSDDAYVQNAPRLGRGGSCSNKPPPMKFATPSEKSTRAGPVSAPPSPAASAASTPGCPIAQASRAARRPI